MLPEEESAPTAPGYRSGYVAVVGAPNVGKSTLVNAYVGQKVAIVTSKPQTTRHRVIGILTRPDAQVIFVDTPGLHRPLHLLGEYMVQVALEALADCDVAIWVVDAARSPEEADVTVAEALRELSSLPVALAVNKLDIVYADVASQRLQEYGALLPTPSQFLISAHTGQGLAELLAWVIGQLPAGPQYYPADQVSDRQERFFVAELIREQVLHHLHQEVPHAVAISVDEFKERENGRVYIAATIYVEKESQKPIVIGANGQMLKRIGSAARAEIESFLEKPVYLDLWVKVRPNWRRSERALRQMGYALRERGTGR